MNLTQGIAMLCAKNAKKKLAPTIVELIVGVDSAHS